MEIVGKYILIMIIMSLCGGSIKKMIDKIIEQLKKIKERNKENDKE